MQLDGFQEQSSKVCTGDGRAQEESAGLVGNKSSESLDVNRMWNLLFLATSGPPAFSVFVFNFWISCSVSHFLITPVLQLIIKLFSAIAINIHFPAEVVHYLSSRFSLIRFCRAAPAGAEAVFVCLIWPPLTIIKKNDTNVGSEST